MKKTEEEKKGRLRSEKIDREKNTQSQVGKESKKYHQFLFDQSYPIHTLATGYYAIDIEKEVLYVEYHSFSYFSKSTTKKPPLFSFTPWKETDVSKVIQVGLRARRTRGYQYKREFIPISNDTDKPLALAIFILKKHIKSEKFIQASIESKPYELPKNDKFVLERLGYIEAYNIAFDAARAVASRLTSKNAESNIIKEKLKKYTSKDSDSFARIMGERLEEARRKGHTSTRQIAEYFNQEGIESAFEVKWSANSVSALIRRRQRLGLENKSIIEKENSIEKQHEKTVFYLKIKEKLDEVRKEGCNSTRQIAKKFNELGLTTITGKNWSHVTVHKFLNQINQTSNKSDLSL